MKIAILVSGFPPKQLAGTEIATHNIAKHLTMRGHEVHVITTLDKGLSKESIVEGFYAHRIKTIERLGFGPISFSIKSLFLINKIHPDILHSQSILRTGLTCFITKKLFKKHYIAYCQGSDIYSSWMFKKVISRLVLKNADAVIALTGDMKREIKKIYDRDIIVIPNGINLERFENLSREDIRRRLKIKEDEKVIVFVGTLRPVKGVKYLIKTMKIITQKGTDTRLMLVGDGVDRGKLEGLVEELDLGKYVKFIGKVPNEEVPEYMVASDVFVLPSLSESFGIVNLEAMASGLPIVATKVGGLPEVVKDGETGFLVEPRNPEQIAEKVLLIFEDDELRERISENNKKKAKEYSWESVVKRLEKVYQNYL